MTGVLIFLALIGFIVYIFLHRSADKAEERFANRPCTIENPAKDLFTNQKYAIVKLLAFIQGASPVSAFDDEANKIVQSTIFSLGLSQDTVVKLLKVSMNHDAEREMQRIFRSLDEIRDRDYLRRLYRKCQTIAEISGDAATIAVTRELFKALKVI